MCRPTTCKTCGKTTWAGCGQHTPAEKAAARADKAHCGGFLARLFGR